MKQNIMVRGKNGDIYSIPSGALAAMSCVQQTRLHHFQFVNPSALEAEPLSPRYESLSSILPEALAAIEVFRYKDTNYVLQAHNILVFRLDECAYEALNYLKAKYPLSGLQYHLSISGYSNGQISGFLQELDQLCRSGLLCAPDDTKEENGDALRHSINVMCLFIEHDCNLRCTYCFVGGGDYGFRQASMELETALIAVDMLITNSDEEPLLSLFGGEPTLNRDLLIDIVRYARRRATEAGRTLQISMTTNGTLLDENLVAFLCEHSVGIILSLDGEKEKHDKHRLMASQARGSFERTLRGLRLLEKKYSPNMIALRATFTKGNMDFVATTEYLNKFNVHTVAIDPVEMPTDHPMALSGEDIIRVRTSIDSLVDFILVNGKAGVLPRNAYMEKFIAAIHKGRRQLRPCHAGAGLYGISTEGDIYPCQLAMGIEDLKMGNVRDGITNAALVSKFERAPMAAIPECGTCWSRYLCSGACYANNYRMTKDIHKNCGFHCGYARYYIKAAIYLYDHIPENLRGRFEHIDVSGIDRCVSE